MVLSSSVTVRAGESFRHRGEAADLSRHGLGLELARPLLPGTRVTVTLESPALPNVWELDELPPLFATVISSRRLGHDRYRLGLVVESLPEELLELLEEADRAPGEHAGDDGALGREALYQIACARLEAKRYDEALQAAVRALAGDPTNPAYRALTYRASAEAALADGHPGDALWHLMKARACAPRDPAILSLLSYLRALTATPAAA